jgi:prolyl-tRNA synthetase
MKLSKNKLYSVERVKDGHLTTTELLECAGYIKKMSNGLYVYLNLGQKVINNINKIVREEFEAIGMNEIGLNQLQTADLWRATGRYDDYGKEMFKFKDRSDNDMIISGTNEELVTAVAKDFITSYKDLSFTWFQTNNKFRDEIRCSNGLIRCKEFVMMDAYSFNLDKEDLEKTYNEVREAYKRIFDRIGLKDKYRIVGADSGEIGGSVSEEFIVDTVDGEVEIGHIFQLDDKYSSKLDVTYTDENNNKKTVIMGCYGIGISRLLQVLAEVNRDGNYLNFYSEVSAYQFAIAVVDVKKEEQLKWAEAWYKSLTDEYGVGSVVLDDRKCKIGKKLHEMDTLGYAVKVLIGKKASEYKHEIKRWSSDDWKETDGDIY